MSEISIIEDTTSVSTTNEEINVSISAETVPTSWGSIEGTLSNQTDLQAELDLKNNITDFDTHVADTTTHGTTGDIVGTSDTQTLSNKKLEDLNTRLMDNLDNTKLAGFELINLTTGTERILTLQDKDIVIADNVDVTAHTSASNIHFIEGDINHVNIQNIGTNSHSVIDTHLASTVNPHSTDIGNLGTGTLAELNTKVTDATLDDSSATRTPSTHVSTHQNGGADELSLTGLSGETADAQKITVRKNTGADVGTRSRLNFIEGANTTITTVDDSGSGEVDITIASSGAGSPLTTKGDLFGYDTGDARIPIGTNNQVLTADSTQTLGLKWATSSAGFSDPMTTRGDIIIRDNTNTTDRLAVGTVGQVLKSDGTDISWDTFTAAPVDSVFTRTGAVVAETNDYTFAQIDKTTSDLADLTTKSHTSLTDKGTNTHPQIDTHIADSTIHFTEGSIDHTAISNIGTNSHSAIDSHIAGTSEHGATGAIVGTTNTQTLSNKTFVDLNTKFSDNLDNTKTAQLELVNLTTATNVVLTLQDKDIVIADNADVTAHSSASSIHFTQGAISIPASQISDFDTEVSNNSSVVLNTAKVTNVSTNLAEGISTTTTVDVNSSDGTNATLVAASTSRAGVMTKAKFDEIVVNNSKTGVTTEISNIVEDTTPELGGELDSGAHTIGFTQQTATGDGTTTIDWKLGNKFKFTFGAFNETFTFTQPTNPCNILLMLVQDATGSRTATWPGTVKWPGGTAPTLSTAASSVDIIGFYFDGTNYFGVESLDFS